MPALSEYDWPEYVSAELRAQFAQAIALHVSDRNVSCIDIGFLGRPITPVLPDALSVRVHFRDKLSKKFRPGLGSPPKEIAGIVGIVGMYGQHPLSAGYALRRALAKPKAAIPRLQPGQKISNNYPMDGSGTLGLLVKRRNDPDANPCLLSCCHVLKSARSGNKWTQPLVHHGIPYSTTPIADIGEAFINNRGDMALATITPPIVPLLHRAQSGGIQVTGTRPPALGDCVTKSGAATVVTSGVIDGIGVYVHRNGSGSEPLLIDCFRVVPAGTARISMPGDSGAVWYDPASLDGIGLNFAGTPLDRMATENFAIAAHLDRVMTHLDVQLW